MIAIEKTHLQGPFIAPPVCQGQAVEYAYACTDSVILERVKDRGHQTEKLIAYHWPAKGESFEPQNGVPKLGRRIGPARLV